MTKQSSSDRADVSKLGTLLRATAADLRRAEPPPEVGQRLLAGFRASRLVEPALAAAPSGNATGQTASGSPGSWQVGRWILPALLLLGAFGWWSFAHRPSAGEARPPAQPMLRGNLDMALLPVDGDPWPRLAQASGGIAWLVNAELPRDRLALLGLPFDPARAGERVPAELLLSPDGEVLAVRLLR